MIEYRVYFHLDPEDSVLYIGQTIDLRARTNSHRLTASWWPQVARVESIGPFDLAGANLCEQGLIEEFRPPHNRQHNPDWHKRAAVPALDVA